MSEPLFELFGLFSSLGLILGMGMFTSASIFSFLIDVDLFSNSSFFSDALG